jgi:hypothetical protein
VAAMVLRPPGLSAQGFAPDEKQLKEVGDKMATASGYRSLYGWELYDTTGTTEDWNYAAQAAFGYTIEIGPKDGEFHMPYQQGFVEQWDGTYAKNGKGLREALLIGAEAATDRKYHSLLSVEAPAGRTLRLSKRFDTMTSAYCAQDTQAPLLNYDHPIIGLLPSCADNREPVAIPDGLDTSANVPFNGTLNWHINPSTRPFETVEKRVPGTISDEVSRTDEYHNTVETRSSQLPQEEGDDRPTFEDVPFKVTAAEQTGRMVVSLEFDGPADDYDFELFRREADGTLTEVGSSGQVSGLSEQYTVEGDAMKPGDYVLRVKNYLALEQGWTATVERYKTSGETVIPPRKETWTLTCSDGAGAPLEKRNIYVERGKALSIRMKCRRK